MNKFIRTMLTVIMAFSLTVGLAIAAPNWIPRQYYGSSQVITTERVVIYDLTIYYAGVTAGDTLTLRNGTSAAATAFFTFVAPAANGTYPCLIKKDWVVDQGIYFEANVSGGSFGINLIYQ